MAPRNIGLHVRTHLGWHPDIPRCRSRSPRWPQNGKNLQSDLQNLRNHQYGTQDLQTGPKLAPGTSRVTRPPRWHPRPLGVASTPTETQNPPNFYITTTPHLLHNTTAYVEPREQLLRKPAHYVEVRPSTQGTPNVEADFKTELMSTSLLLHSQNKSEGTAM